MTEEQLQKFYAMAEPRSEDAIRKVEERKMKRENKELLLKDLCARLPYNVWVSYKTKYDDIERATILNGNYVRDIMEGTSSWIDFKPYLRPMSSMTEEEAEEYCNNVTDIGSGVDWLNKNMFDYRGLIPKDLALSIEEYNPYKE